MTEQNFVTGLKLGTHFSMKTNAPYCYSRLGASLYTVWMIKRLLTNRKQRIWVSNFQWHLHYQMILSEAYKILGLLCRDFSSSVFLCLYQQSAPCIYSLYCSVVWFPYDICMSWTCNKMCTTVHYRSCLINLHLLPSVSNCRHYLFRYIFEVPVLAIVIL